MKSVLSFAAIMATLALAAPAQACRVSTPPKAPALPPYAERIVFTATINERWGTGVRFAGADLLVRRRLLGEAPDHVDATWSRLEWPVEAIEPPSTDEVELTQVIIVSCASRSWYEARLQAAPMGSEVAVLARRTPSGVDVQDLAPVGSEEGRRLLALVNP